MQASVETSHGGSFIAFLYAEGVTYQSPGSRSAPWGTSDKRGLNPERVQYPRLWPTMEPFQGSCQLLISPPGCAARPWALISNPFGVGENSATPSLQEVLCACSRAAGRACTIDLVQNTSEIRTDSEKKRTNAQFMRTRPSGAPPESSSPQSLPDNPLATPAAALKMLYLWRPLDLDCFSGSA